jgi:integrase
LRQFTEPLASVLDPAKSTKLFLYRTRSTNRRGKLIAPGITPEAFYRHFQEFTERHRLPRFTLANIRPTAATQLYLETGGNLRKVQQFLQHANLAIYERQNTSLREEISRIQRARAAEGGNRA